MLHSKYKVFMTFRPFLSLVGLQALHLIDGFQRFGHAFLVHHGSLDDVQPVFAGGVDFRQMGNKFFCEQQGAVKGVRVILQIGVSHLAIFTDVVLLRVSRYKVED